MGPHGTRRAHDGVGMETPIETVPPIATEQAITDEQNPAQEEWTYLAHLPIPLTVSIPLPSITLGELMKLEAGKVLVSQWAINREVPLMAGETFLALVDFERAGDQLGVRISGFQMGGTSA